ncbi:MAG: 4-vinyl reductase [Nanoarchaeota archaeon]|nr:4-vinyl reductase [Nanoarchaeota archaeon]
MVGASLLDKVRRFNAIKHDDKGRIMMWGITGILMPNFSRVIFQEYLKKTVGKEECMKVLYTHGKLQSYFTFRFISKKYGYKEKLKDKVRLLHFNMGQGALVGMGRCEIKRIDRHNRVFIGVSNSSLAEEYKMSIGIKDEAVDHFLRGCFAAYVEAVTGEEMFCVEKKCIAKGDKLCEFVIKPLSEWDKEDEDFKKQLSETPDCDIIISGLGFKIHQK